ncbi:MAG TPA: hypothetical protein PKW66_16580, partial [Polyangiaceae bacterium]|nr:hypothetical protein [Polyangiaceae bacterium]
MAAGFSLNWFIAIPIDPEGWFAPTPSPPDGIRLFHQEDLHLTLAFLGSVSEQQARAGWEALRWNLAPTTVTLGAVVPMGAPGRYSALSATLEQGRATIEQAIGACRDAICDAAGARRESRSPKAHITIARPSRNASDSTRAGGLRWAQRIDYHQPSVPLHTIALYTWANDRKVRQFRTVLRASWQELSGNR